MRNKLTWLALAICAGTFPLGAATKSKKEKETPKTVVISTAPTTFALMPGTNEVASIWNDPHFQRRLVGSYGFAPDAEPPPMVLEEQTAYREKIVPLLQQDPKLAIEPLKTLINPSSSAVFDFTLGNVYFQNDDLTNAVRHFEAALAKFPDYRRAQKNLAFALVRSGRYGEAIKPLTRTVSMGAGDGKVYSLLAFACVDQGHFVAAEAAYRQALVFEPDNVDLKMGLVKCSLATANYDFALGLLDELIKQYPERDNLWSLQANIYIQKEQPAKAAITLEIIRRMGKATAQNLFLLGDLYMTQEARDVALDTYIEAIDKDGGQNLAKALRPAQIMVSRGAWDEARKLFGKIRASGKALADEDELKLLKLESKVALSTGAGEQAIATLEQILKKNPVDGEVLLLTGDYYSKNGQKEKAEFRYTSAANISGYEADALVKHAQLLVQSQKYAQAAELLRKAQKTNPRDNVQRYLEKVEQLARAGRS